MRIIDKKTDFYDFLQAEYRDTSTTFDRTDSYMLTKKIVCDKLYRYEHDRWNSRLLRGVKLHEYNMLLLQVCNTFWLFLLETTQKDSDGTPLDYTAELLCTWKNYRKERVLIRLDVISFRELRSTWYHNRCWRIGKDVIAAELSRIVKDIDAGNFEVIGSLNRHTIYNGDGSSTEKHIPLLSASGLAQFIEPLEIYNAFDEYFSLEKTASERDSSIGITDREKIVNHGFDEKTSFRGKRKES